MRCLDFMSCTGTVRHFKICVNINRQLRIINACTSLTKVTWLLAYIYYFTCMRYLRNLLAYLHCSLADSLYLLLSYFTCLLFLLTLSLIHLHCLLACLLYLHTYLHTLLLYTFRLYLLTYLLTYLLCILHLLYLLYLLAHCNGVINNCLFFSLTYPNDSLLT